MKILSIDPGNVHSAYCIIETETMQLIDFGIKDNDLLVNIVMNGTFGVVVIEMIASYGMAVGKEVFDTCVWIGRYMQKALDSGKQVEFIYRMEEKQTICHDSRAKDSNIRQALIDRFARYDFKNGKGTKRDPDYFYGFSKDMWAAFAVAVTWKEKREQHD